MKMKMRKEMDSVIQNFTVNADGTDVPIKIKFQKAGLQPAYKGDEVIIEVTAILPCNHGSSYLDDSLVCESRLSFFGDDLITEWGYKIYDTSKYIRRIVKKFVATTYTAALEAAEEYVNKEIEELTNFFNNRAALLKAADE